MATRGPEATRGWVKIVVRRRVSLDGLQHTVHPQLSRLAEAPTTVSQHYAVRLAAVPAYSLILL